MKIAITGASGMVGRTLVSLLQKKTSHSIFQIGGPQAQRPYYSLNLTKEKESIDLLQSIRPDLLIHLAAFVGGIGRNVANPATMLATNLKISQNILDAARIVQVPQIITMGSCCAYPKYCPLPFKEEDLWLGYPDETNAPYGISKRALLLLGQTYRQQYGMKISHFIPANLYGPHDLFDLDNGHVIPVLIRKFVEAQEGGLPQVQCYGSGQASREFLYAPDLCDFLLRVIQVGWDGSEPMNVGTGREISIYDLAHLIAALVGYSGQIVFGQVQPHLNGQPRRQLDTSKAENLLNWKYQTSLEDGLRRTIQWYRSSVRPISMEQMELPFITPSLPEE